MLAPLPYSGVPAWRQPASAPRLALRLSAFNSRGATSCSPRRCRPSLATKPRIPDSRPTPTPKPTPGHVQPAPSRVVRAQLPQPGPPSAWPDVVAHHPKDLLQSAVALKGDNLVLRYLRDVRGTLALHK